MGSIDKGVTFAFDSAQLTPAAEGPLTIAGSILQRDRSIGLEVIGHADSTGPADYNLDLSRRRAQAVADALVAAGISSDRLFVDAMGEAEPMMDNATEDGRAANRRVGFRFDLLSRLGGSNG